MHCLLGGFGVSVNFASKLLQRDISLANAPASSKPRESAWRAPAGSHVRPSSVMTACSGKYQACASWVVKIIARQAKARAIHGFKGDITISRRFVPKSTRDD